MEGFGNKGTGRAGDPRGSLQSLRNILASGEYRHVGRLSPADVDLLSEDHFTLQRLQREGEGRGVK